MEQMSHEEVMQKVQSGKPYTLLFLLAGKPTTHDDEAIQQMQMNHLAHLFTMEQEGRVSVFGPVTGEGSLRGIIVFNTADKDLVATWMADDPYIQNGYLTYELHDFFTIPGQVVKPY
jgi:uncharacterized protein YciI